MAVMTDELKTYLKEVGVSDETVAKVEVQEVLTLADLKSVVDASDKVSELRANLEISMGAASKIWNDQKVGKGASAPASAPSSATPAPAAASTAAPAGGGQATLMAGLTAGLGRLLGPDKMPVRDLIQAVFVDREVDPEYRQALRTKTGNADLFAVDPATGQFNMEATMQAFDDWAEFGEVGEDITCNDKVYVLNSLQEALARMAESDPMDGSRLKNGVSVKTRADWSKVARDRRIIAAFGSMYCSNLVEGINSREAAKELSEADLPAHWQAVEAQVKSSQRLADGRYEAALARLVYRRRGSGARRSRNVSARDISGIGGRTRVSDPLSTGNGSVGETW